MVSQVDRITFDQGILRPRDDSEFGEVILTDSEKKSHTFSWHIPSGQVGNNDSVGVIWFKFLFLATVGTAWATAKRIVFAVLDIFATIGQYVLYKITKKEKFRITGLEVLGRIAESLQDIGWRIIGYGIALEFVALAGLFSPKLMRMRYSELEFNLNRGAKISKGCYEAPCFQPLANVNNTNWMESKRFKNHVLLTKELKAVIDQFLMKFSYAKEESYRRARDMGLVALPVQRNLIAVSTSNQVSPQGLEQCLKSAHHPIPRKNYDSVGRDNGLRVCRDIQLKPTEACVGMSMTFLSSGIEAVKAGATTKCVETQALYSALWNAGSDFSDEEFESLRQILKGEVNSSFIKNSELAKVINEFRQAYRMDQKLLLRSYVLNELEKRGHDITPTIYGLVQELDAFWTVQNNPNLRFRRYDGIHDAVIATIGALAKLKITRECDSQEKPKDIDAFYKGLSEGKHLIMAPTHAFVLIKNGESCEVFDAPLGLIPLKKSETRNAVLTSLFKNYCRTDNSLFSMYSVT